MNLPGTPSNPPPTVGSPCGNCGTPLLGAWCHACGQKRVGQAERRLPHLLGQFFEALTDLDSRFWRTLRALMLQPGRLSRDYLDGRRARWMPPMTLFLLATVAYFLAPGLTDFQLPFSAQVDGPVLLEMIEADGADLDDDRRRDIARHRGQLHSPWTARLVEERVAARDARARQRDPAGRYTVRDYARAYDAKVAEVSKLLVVIHLPMIAAALALLYWRRRMLFAEHFVVATHVFAFLLLTIQLLMPVALIAVRHFGVVEFPTPAKLVIGTLVLAHVGLGLHRVYAGRRWSALLVGALLLLLTGIGSLLVYRTLQFLLVFALT
jgi:hypothetical protein